MQCHGGKHSAMGDMYALAPRHVSYGSFSTEMGCPRLVCFPPIATRQQTSRIGSFVPQPDSCSAVNNLSSR